MDGVERFLKKNIINIAWMQALVATMGSLFFSEVLKYTPCKLCWWQRIAMYPLSVILLIGLRRRDKNVFYYAAPLAISGWLIALYHNLIYYHVISEAFVPCSEGIPCTAKQFFWFGFLSIPLLSLAAFSVINVCLWFYWKTVLKPKMRR